VDLIFNVKKEYFDLVKSGHKTFEYREIKPYWTKRLGKKYSGIQYKLGYPAFDDDLKILKFEYRGYFLTNIDLMGEGFKDVFAFPLVPRGLEILTSE